MASMSEVPTKRVLVIGAGASGLPSIKACKEYGLDVLCYEKTEDFGGLWRYRDKSVDGVSSVMKSTVMNTSKEMSAFSDFPPPENFPTYMHHTVAVKYLKLYAEHFGLMEHIAYQREVVEVKPAEDYEATGRWLAKSRDYQSGNIREEIFDGIMVCTGHHAFPNKPSYPNMDEFTGEIIHSHEYKNCLGMADKNVLVVGFGNSGVDIAVELASVARKVYLSTKKGAWVYNRSFDKGKPMDVTVVRRRVLSEKALVKQLNARLDHERFGIKPEHSIRHQHATISQELGAKMLAGSVVVKNDIGRFFGKGLLFRGEEEVTPLDVVVFATGYHIRFPFLSDDVIDVGDDNRVGLYKHVFPTHLKHHTLAFIGLIQPGGSLFPIFELQARWYMEITTGKCHLPSEKEMKADVEAYESSRASKYGKSLRHTIEVAWIEYADFVAKEMGAKPHLSKMFLKDPRLFRACVFGPCLPYQFRLEGPHKWEGARNAILTYKDRLYYHMKKKVSPTHDRIESGFSS